MGSRRQGREISLQALYRVELTGDASPEPMELLWQHFEAPLEARGFALELVHGVLGRRDAIDRKLGNAGFDAQRLEDAEIRVDHMAFVDVVHPAAAWIGGFGVKPARQPFARVARRESDHARGARRPRQRGRLDQPLQIDRHVVFVAAQLANRRHHARVGHDEAAIDDGHKIQDLAMLRADEPVDPRGGIGATERRRDRNGVDDVTESA